MAQQRIFRQRFIDDLCRKINSGEGIDFFRNTEFQISDRDTLINPHIKMPDNLLAKLKVEDHFSSAISIFEAFEYLTPLEAGDTRFWNYLSLKDLYPYLRERWPGLYKRKQIDDESKYIFDHFIIDKISDLMRCWLSGLWWSVYISFDPSDKENKYKLTEVLFWNETLRTRTMGTYLLARKKETAMGFLDYCYQRGYDKFGNFEKEHQELTKYLNKLGGTTTLSLFEKEEITKILSDRFPITV
jgi:hypothetical protein